MSTFDQYDGRINGDTAFERGDWLDGTKRDLSLRYRPKHAGEKMVNIWQWATRLRTWKECEICGVPDQARLMVHIWDGSPDDGFYSRCFCQCCWDAFVYG